MNKVFQKISKTIGLGLVLALLAACGGGGEQPSDTISPVTSTSSAGGEFDTAQEVTLTCNDTGGSGCAAIYYTVDGSTPTESSPRYAAPIVISDTQALKFFAVDGVGNRELVNTIVFYIGPPPPLACAPPPTPGQRIVI